ncbi:FecR family protein [Parapedobacter soli]|uniref:FecR family protein n=1 Tax=Parapedobacter soli TaxID=416955 RepID=UPI0021C6650B|nr:FecR family protein [Parapedobacter soli]
MKKAPITTLFQKYLNNQISPEELQDLLHYFEHSEVGDDLTPLIKQALDHVAETPDELLVRAMADRAERRIIARTVSSGQSKRWTSGHWLRVAAAALIIMAGGTYFYLKSPDGLQAPVSQFADIAPGSNQARLTLPDGRTIDLNTAQRGITVEDGIKYTDGTEVVVNQQPISGAQRSNNQTTVSPMAATMSLSTPKGGQYQIILPDGTNVWLNAASMLRYPTQFTGDTREVELDGEGYFEVAKDAHQPFLVKSNGQVVKVLGTEFNVNAYRDEVRVTTTLVEGSVEVASQTATAGLSVKSVGLKPGQQAAFEDGHIHVTEVDASDYVAWKDGRFVFYSEPLPLVIRKIERWYDVSFEHRELAEDIELWGSLSRNVMLSEILEVIELNTPLTFERKGRRIIVSRK